MPEDVDRERFIRCHQLLNGYPFSVVIVKDVDFESAVEIFERINRAGKRLTRYDLITATVLTDNFDLRERTQKDIIEPLEETFGSIAETSIPQALALNIKNSAEHITQMQLKDHEVQSVWQDTVECFKLAVDFVKQNLGVTRASFLPYNAILPVLAYYFYTGKTKTLKSPEHREQIERWFWRVTFSERYSGSSQTRMSDDAAWIRSLLEDDATYDEPIVTGIDTLLETSMRSSSAIRNGVLCLLNLQNPLHFKNATRINTDNSHYSVFNSPEKHHIFPASFLEKSGYRASIVHKVPNFCFIPSELNKWIGSKKPSEYMQSLHEELGDEHFDQVMRSHLIPVDKHSGIWNDNYERFLKQRAELIIREIKWVCGIADTVAEEDRDPIINAIEHGFRNMIHEVLSSRYGLDYWDEAIPKGISKKVERRLEDEVKQIPGAKKAHYDDARSKLAFCDVLDYARIILENWYEFSTNFKNADTFDEYMRAFNDFRKAVKHSRHIDSLLKHRAQAAIIWLGRSLDLDLSQYDVIME